MKKCNYSECKKKCIRKCEKAAMNLYEPFVFHGIHTGCFNYVSVNI